MAEINYSKAEKEVEKAVQDTTIKKSLVEGKSIKSSRAIEYFNLDEETSRPTPEDRVAKLISETAAEEEENEKRAREKPSIEREAAPGTGHVIAASPKAKSEGDIEEEEEFDTILEIPYEDSVRRSRKQSSRTPKKPPAKHHRVLPSEKFVEQVSPLIILRKHILWFKQQHIEDRYERLGTTKQEVFSIRKAERLTEKQVQRVLELNERAEKLKKELLKKGGKTSSEELIEKEKKKHLHKRFHTRETWVPI